MDKRIWTPTSVISGNGCKHLQKTVGGRQYYCRHHGYQPACKDYNIIRLGRWAHARRKFVEAKTMQPKNKTGKANRARNWIQSLYRIEATRKKDPPEKRYRIRQEQAQPSIDS